MEPSVDEKDAGEPSREKKGASYKDLLRFAWLILVACLACWYAYKNREGLSQAVRELSLAATVASLVGLYVGKVLIALMIRKTLRRSGASVTFGQAFGMYNATQVAKYLPGSVWHFIGRAALYRQIGLSRRQIGSAMLAENAWLVLGSLLTSVSLITAQYVFVSDHSWAAPMRSFLASNSLLTYAAVAAAPVGVAVLGVAVWFKRRAFAEMVFRVAMPGPQAVVLMIAVQVTLALSIYALVRDLTPAAPLLYTVGVCAAATGLGYVALFAPAGLGVKDVVIISLLAPFVSSEQAFLAVSLHRLLYLAMDFVLGLIQAGGFSARSKPDAEQPAGPPPAGG